MSESHFEQFTLTLSSILKSIKKLEGGRMSQFGLRSSHVMILYQLDKHPDGLTPADLAESGSVDKALISRAIAELQEKDLVRPMQTNGKKYKARLLLTPAGKEVALYIVQTVDDIQHQVSGNIPEADLAVFYRTLFALQKNFTALAKKDAGEEKE